MPLAPVASPHQLAALAAQLAANDGSTGLAWLALAVLTAAGYITACVIWPFAACRHCAGTGKHRSPSGRAWRTCRHCRGTGGRIRIGRRIWTALHHTHRDGTRHDRKDRP